MSAAKYVLKCPECDGDGRYTNGSFCVDPGDPPDVVGCAACNYTGCVEAVLVEKSIVDEIEHNVAVDENTDSVEEEKAARRRLLELARTIGSPDRNQPFREPQEHDVYVDRETGVQQIVWGVYVPAVTMRHLSDPRDTHRWTLAEFHRRFAETNLQHRAGEIVDRSE